MVLKRKGESREREEKTGEERDKRDIKTRTGGRREWTERDRERERREI